jgi:hypothetical protein
MVAVGELLALIALPVIFVVCAAVIVDAFGRWAR